MEPPNCVRRVVGEVLGIGTDSSTTARGMGVKCVNSDVLAGEVGRNVGQSS